jgi:hypothetical protein
MMMSIGAIGEDALEANRRELSLTLIRTAEVFERSAELAAAHADRHERAGRTDKALSERQTAARASELASRARLQAAKFAARTAG